MPRARFAVSPRALLRRLRPPGPLAALLGIVAIAGLCWALTVPPWQSPDELSHYAYVEAIATGPRLAGGATRAPFSKDQVTAIDAVDASETANSPVAVPPVWSRAAYRDYLRSTGSITLANRDDGGGLSSASGNPPAYYFLAAVGYLIDGGGTAFGRLYAMRIEGIVLLLLTTIGAWLLAGETLGRRRLSQLATAATAALLPMVTFMSTNVNPDALIITEWTFLLWLAARIVCRSAQIADVASMCALLAAAILTKATSYALVPAELLAVVIGIRRRPIDERRATFGRSAASALIAIVPVGLWLALSRSVGGTGLTTVGSSTTHRFNVRQFLSYLWQFYLPKLPFMTSFRLVGGTPAITVWIDQGAGVFGWLDVPLPAWMFTFAKAAVAVLVLGSAWVLARLRGLTRLGLLGLDLLALVALLVLLHVTEYRQTLTGGGAFLQGRYLLPVVSLLGLAVGLLLSRLPRWARPAAGSLILIGLIAGQVLSLATVLHAYYL